MDHEQDYTRVNAIIAQHRREVTYTWLITLAVAFMLACAIALIAL